MWSAASFRKCNAEKWYYTDADDKCISIFRDAPGESHYLFWYLAIQSWVSVCVTVTVTVVWLWRLTKNVMYLKFSTRRWNLWIPRQYKQVILPVHYLYVEIRWYYDHQWGRASKSREHGERRLENEKKKKNVFRHWYNTCINATIFHSGLKFLLEMLVISTQKKPRECCSLWIQENKNAKMVWRTKWFQSCAWRTQFFLDSLQWGFLYW